MAPSGNADHTEISNIDHVLRRHDTDASITIPKDVFEKLYLTPKLPIKGQLRSTLANPTPLALVGFVMTTSPLACVLMGWRGASNLATLMYIFRTQTFYKHYQNTVPNRRSISGVFYFFGGSLQIIACVLEFILGNTFPCVVFGTFGAFWLAIGLTNQYVIPNAEDPINFYRSFGYVPAFFGILMLMFGICALRTNAVFVTLFALILTVAELLASAYWSLADGSVEHAAHLLKGAGALTFAMTMLAFYLLFAMLLESVDFPLTLPVGDLSTRFRGKRARMLESAGEGIAIEEA